MRAAALGRELQGGEELPAVPRPKAFIALITGTNERGEIRVHFHVVTDGQGQFKRPIAELLKTLTAYGHKHPYLFSTDQPSVGDIFFKHEIVSLQAKHDELDHLGFTTLAEPANAELEAGAFTLLTTTARVNGGRADGTLTCLGRAPKGKCKIALPPH